MRKLFGFLFLTVVTAQSAQAIVIRDDVDDSNYHVDDALYPALVSKRVIVSQRWCTNVTCSRSPIARRKFKLGARLP